MKGYDFTTGGCKSVLWWLVRPKRYERQNEANQTTTSSAVKKKKDTGQKYYQEVLSGMLSMIQLLKMAIKQACCGIR